MSQTIQKEPIIEIEHVSKWFGEEKVLDDVSLSIYAGKIYGLVGRNGSGKTMLMKCICGFVQPNQGKITVDGKLVGDKGTDAFNIGFIIEKPSFLPQYNAYKNLAYLYSVNHKVDKMVIEKAIRVVGLDPQDKKKVRKFSMGMKQRLGIAQAIMENPNIVLLDEPFNGLDNNGVEEMRTLFLRMREEGKTILLVSHNREDIALLCDKVYEMDHGKICSYKK